MQKENIIEEIKDIWNSQNIYIKNCFNKIKEYDDELYIHSINVAVISFLIGKKVYKNYADVENVFITGLLHDYGKLFISKEILNKRTRLTVNEKKEIEKHTILGYLKLKEENCFNNEILQGVLNHHERINGIGYPGGKREAEISRFAKIVMIADIYNALITDRIYRPKVRKDLVIDYIQDNAGKTLSKPLVKHFLNIISTIDIEHISNSLKHEIYKMGMLI